jgi:hypothetical protein
MFLPPRPIVFYPPQPFPQFYVIRPDQTAVPLVALDELPSWLQVGNWDWRDPILFHSMAPASLFLIPRMGEYDVLCHYCCSGLEILQRTISQNSEASSSYHRLKANTKSLTTGPVSCNLFQDSSPIQPASRRVSRSEPQIREDSRGLGEKMDHGNVFLKKDHSPSVSSCCWPMSPPKSGRIPTDTKVSLSPKAQAFDPSTSKRAAVNSLSSSIMSDEFKANIFSPNSGWTCWSSHPKPPAGQDGNTTVFAGSALIERPNSTAPGLPGSAEAHSQPGQDFDAKLATIRQYLGIPTNAVGPSAMKAPKRGTLGIEKRPGNIPNQPPHSKRKGRSRRRRRTTSIFNGEPIKDRENPLSRPKSRLAKGRESRGRRSKVRTGLCPGSRYWDMMKMPNWRAEQ